MTKEVEALFNASVALLDALDRMDAMDKDVDMPYLEKQLDRAVKDVEFSEDWGWSAAS
jgi:hypothetical protein